MGRRGIRGLKTRVEQECSISRGGPDCTVKVYRSEESEEEVTVLRVETKQVEDSSNSERESCEHLRWIHLEQVQHCTDLPRQVTFPAHTEQGKMGPGLG